jgi:hypothetical protein
MAIFWGGGSKSKNYDGLWVPYFCSSCSKLSPFSVTENYKYGQVYGIRIAKFKSKYFLVCPTCDRVIVIENKEKFMSAQRIESQKSKCFIPNSLCYCRHLFLVSVEEVLQV